MLSVLQSLDSTQSRQAFRLAFLQQVPISLLCALTLDGGLTARICGVAMLGYWVAVGWLVLRRPHLNSRTDLVFIRWGFLPLFAASVAMAVYLKKWS
jgi:ABC-type antimicrobial peptide transport system permease subunit